MAAGCRLQYTIDQTALQQRIENVFGRRILMTDQKTWSTAEIIMGYRGQAQVENVFRIAMIAEKMEKTPDPAKVRYQLEEDDTEPFTKQLIEIFKIEAKSPKL